MRSCMVKPRHAKVTPHDCCTATEDTIEGDERENHTLSKVARPSGLRWYVVRPYSLKGF